MTKKAALIAVLAMLLIIASCGCSSGGSRNAPIDDDDSSSEYEVDDEGFTVFSDSKYKVPSALKIVPEIAESEGLTINQKRYYIDQNVELTPRTFIPNLSVEIAEYRYTADEHVRFREGILASLNAQLSNTQAQVNGAGMTTEKGLVLYKFTITEAEQETIQYYIPGDHVYFLIHSTSDFGDSQEMLDTGAMEIANSFEWL